MSMTAQEICRLALLRMRIVARDEAMQPEDAAHALTVLNLMLHGFAARGVDLNHSDYEASSDVQLPRDLHDGLIHMLAARLAPDFAVTLPTSTGFDEQKWWRAMQAAYFDPEDVDFELGLQFLPSQRWRYGVT